MSFEEISIISNPLDGKMVVRWFLKRSHQKIILVSFWFQKSLFF